MTISIKVVAFEDQKVDDNNTLSDSGTLKKAVTLEVSDTEIGSTYTASKWLTISNSKSDDDYTKDAYDASKSEITAWENSLANIGKTFNPNTGKME